MNVLFLYSEVAAYSLACAEALHVHHGYQIHIVRWPVHQDAPFKFRAYKGITFYERSEMEADDIFTLYQKLQPQWVYVSGWLDKAYVQVCRKIRSEKTPVICGLDTHWRGDFRQRIASWISPFYFKIRFSHLFIPGIYQYEYARRLGFPPNKILHGLYSADLTPFHEAYERNLKEKQKKYPHNFLYVGRFVTIKGVEELVEAFLELGEEMEHNWNLTLVGAGELSGKLPQNSKLTYRSFVQPDKLPDLAVTAGCYILPSRHEPWGVVLHEFAGAGLPLITSDNCGAATAFLRNGYNGFSHEAGSKKSIKEALKKVIMLSDAELLSMGERSVELSYQISPESWAATMASLRN